MTSEYPRFLTPGSTPFDPIELAGMTEEISTREGAEGLERKYTDFYSVPVYGGIATGYAAGCCLRCVYCWSNWSRDFPEKFGEFYSPKKVVQRLFKAAEDGITYSKYWRRRIPKINKLRLSGCEPTIGRKHLLSVLKLVKDSKYPLFILETNGILFGVDRSYVKELVPFAEKLYVRVSFKAGTPEGFNRRTGAIGEYYDLPFRALRYLLDEGVYARAAAMTDPRIMPEVERKILKEKLAEIDPSIAGNLEEEKIDTYDTTIKRLNAAKIKIPLHLSDNGYI
jgi:uncharacterized Fe-S cluster-containing radical SAM superfamily protein